MQDLISFWYYSNYPSDHAFFTCILKTSGDTMFLINFLVSSEESSRLSKFAKISAGVDKVVCIINETFILPIY